MSVAPKASARTAARSAPAGARPARAVASATTVAAEEPLPPPALSARGPRAPRVAPPSGPGDFVRSVYEVARKEVLQNIRTKRLLVIGLVLVFLLAMVTLVFGPGIMKNGDPDGEISLEHQVLVFYFAIGLIGGLQFTQMLAIVLTSDAVCSEWASRTIFLLLSKPVSRTAFVLGKFLGAAVTVCVTLGVLFTLFYFGMQPFYDGQPSADETGSFFAMVGVVLLGATAFAAMSMFVSTLTKSTTMSVLLVLAAWLIVFPVLGNVGFFIEAGQRDADFDSASVDAWRYLNPAGDMQAAARLLVPEGSELSAAVTFFNVFQTTPEHISWAIFALAMHTVLWVALSLVVVQRRNFE